MNQDVSGNRTLFWKETGKGDGGKVKSCYSIKDRTGSLEEGSDDVRKI